VCAKDCFGDKGEFGASRKFRPFLGLFIAIERSEKAIGGRFCLTPTALGTGFHPSATCSKQQAVAWMFDRPKSGRCDLSGDCRAVAPVQAVYPPGLVRTGSA
jgi:hypothetical protein